MATIKPFRGTRYTEKAGKLAELCCPPYDIISEEERRALLETNPHNIIRLELPRSYKDGEENSDLDSYREAGDCVRNWVGGGILADDAEENLYVYEFSFDLDGTTRAVKGFVALVQIEEFSKGIILPHEETLSKAKTDRFNLMTATGCNFSQIYSLYSDSGNEVVKILDSATTNAPDSEFTDKDKVTHRLWKISDKEAIAKIAKIMADKQLFIADGHHRYETSLKYRDSVSGRPDYANSTAACVPMMLVNMENTGLTVFPTHRLVRDLPGFGKDKLDALIEKSREYFNISQGLTRQAAQEELRTEYAKGVNAFALYAGGDYTVMSLKDKTIMDSILPDEDKSLRLLDVSVLHSLILERLFGIDKENMAQQKNLTYVKDEGDAIAAVDSGKANCCFLLNATRISEIRDVSLANGKMPQKSTYFYPKLTTGLVINRIFK